MKKAILQSILKHHKASDLTFTLCDVGARGKLGDDFEALNQLGQLKWIGFEPEPAAAAALRKKYPNATISESGLGREDGPATLKLTRNPGCASVLEPNMDVLAHYPIRSWFEVEREVPIELRRYDSLMQDLDFPALDFIKIDTQGLELDILQGMGPYLRDAICLEIEVHVLPLYRDQALLTDIYAFLFERGFELITLQQQGRFEGAAIEYNAFFIKRVESMNNVQLRKSRVWQMMKGVFRAGASVVPIADTTHFPPDQTRQYLRAADKLKFENEAHMKAKRAEFVREHS